MRQWMNCQTKVTQLLIHSLPFGGWATIEEDSEHPCPISHATICTLLSVTKLLAILLAMPSVFHYFSNCMSYLVSIKLLLIFYLVKNLPIYILIDTMIILQWLLLLKSL